MIDFNYFAKIDIRVGTIIEAENFKEAIKPAYKLKINFGDEVGIKQTSAQITENYQLKELIGKQVIAVVNFPKKQIANFMSEVLVLGVYSSTGVVLLSPLEKVSNGSKIG